MHKKHNWFEVQALQVYMEYCRVSDRHCMWEAMGQVPAWRVRDTTKKVVEIVELRRGHPWNIKTIVTLEYQGRPASWSNHQVGWRVRELIFRDYHEGKLTSVVKHFPVYKPGGYQILRFVGVDEELTARRAFNKPDSWGEHLEDMTVMVKGKTYIVELHGSGGEYTQRVTLSRVLDPETRHMVSIEELAQVGLFMEMYHGVKLPESWLS